MRARALAALAPLLALAACGADFLPRSYLADLRVLAIVGTDPDDGAPRLDVLPGERLALTPVRLAPPAGAGLPTSERWRFCPFSIGSQAGYACAVPACEVELTAAGSPPRADPQRGVTALAEPSALIQQCLEALGGELPPGVPAELPDSVDLLFTYEASDGTTTRSAVQRVPYHPHGAPALGRNVPPVVRCVTIGGRRVWGDAAACPPDDGPGPSLPAGGAVAVRVLLDPASAQTYTGAAGEVVTESLVVSFYTSAGRFADDRGNGPDASSNLEDEALPPGTHTARVWAVARDLRGGEVAVGPFDVAAPR